MDDDVTVSVSDLRKAWNLARLLNDFIDTEFAESKLILPEAQQLYDIQRELQEYFSSLMRNVPLVPEQQRAGNDSGIAAEESGRKSAEQAEEADSPQKDTEMNTCETCGQIRIHPTQPRIGPCRVKSG